jgi:hypothetical protein
MYCPKCGKQNDDNSYRCTSCGAVIQPIPQPAVVVDDSIGALIPARNPKALWAYYLGVFSLIPCIGILLGIPAFLLGLQARRFARENPQAKGGAHAWVGIIVGGLSAFGQLLLILVWWVASRTP